MSRDRDLKNTDFDATNLQGRSSTVGFAGVRPAVSWETGLIIVGFVLALIVGSAYVFR